MQIYVIDAGNTSIKLGHFDGGQLHNVQRFALDQIDQLLEELRGENASKIVISSVISDAISDILLSEFDGFLVNHAMNLPIKMEYLTPNSLGIDRLCNAVAVQSEMKTEYGVSIDVGTCIKFDLVHKTKGYLGGSIAPGIDLRFKSLNDYTEKLPLLSNKSKVSLVGNNTETSIRSGVMNGINAEIAGFVAQYESLFDSLTFFMTGGDASYFDIQVKNDIFADENLTLKGLFEIYKHNA